MTQKNRDNEIVVTFTISNLAVSAEGVTGDVYCCVEGEETFCEPRFFLPIVGEFCRDVKAQMAKGHAQWDKRAVQ